MARNAIEVSDDLRMGILVPVYKKNEQNKEKVIQELPWQIGLNSLKTQTRTTTTTSTKRVQKCTMHTRPTTSRKRERFVWYTLQRSFNIFTSFLELSLWDKEGGCEF